jgi:hypothetical protein
VAPHGGRFLRAAQKKLWQLPDRAWIMTAVARAGPPFAAWPVVRLGNSRLRMTDETARREQLATLRRVRQATRSRCRGAPTSEGCDRGETSARRAKLPPTGKLDDAPARKSPSRFG